MRLFLLQNNNWKHWQLIDIWLNLENYLGYLFLKLRLFFVLIYYLRIGKLINHSEADKCYLFIINNSSSQYSMQILLPNSRKEKSFIITEQLPNYWVQILLLHRVYLQTLLFDRFLFLLQLRYVYIHWIFTKIHIVVQHNVLLVLLLHEILKSRHLKYRSVIIILIYSLASQRTVTLVTPIV